MKQLSEDDVRNFLELCEVSSQQLHDDPIIPGTLQIETINANPAFVPLPGPGNGVTIQNASPGTITVMSDTPFGSITMQVQPTCDVGFVPINAGSAMDFKVTVCRLKTIRARVPVISGGFPPRIDYEWKELGQVPVRGPAQSGGDALPSNLPLGRYTIDSDGTIRSS
jgi:hypothetical protein